MIAALAAPVGLDAAQPRKARTSATKSHAKASASSKAQKKSETLDDIYSSAMENYRLNRFALAYPKLLKTAEMDHIRIVLD